MSKNFLIQQVKTNRKYKATSRSTIQPLANQPSDILDWIHRRIQPDGIDKIRTSIFEILLTKPSEANTIRKKIRKLLKEGSLHFKRLSKLKFHVRNQNNYQ